VLAVIGQVLDKLRLVPYLGQALQVAGMYAWALASFFVVPVLVVQREATAIGSLRQSVALASKQWGKATSGIVTIGLVAGALAVILLLVIFALGIPLMASMAGDVAAWVPLAAVFVPVFLVVAVLMAVQGAATTAYQAALYRYARSGKVPRGFTRASLVDPWDAYRMA